MANMHNEFLAFEQAISITPKKIKRLIASRRALESLIMIYFKQHPNLPVPKFYIQGSYKMGTMVMDKEGTYDVDLGIYFLTKPSITPITLQENVLKAVKNHTEGGIQHRDKCIRVIYKGDFDIDLPVYYQTYKDNHPFLATKNGWIKDDPKELCNWFESKKDKNGQMIRVIKYIKTWANIRSHKMPSGLAFTVWVGKQFKPNNRDDIALFETLNAMRSDSIFSLTCDNPATPGDNLVAKLDSTQLRNFNTTFKSFKREAESAIRADNKATSLNIWRQLLGNQFPTQYEDYF